MGNSSESIRRYWLWVVVSYESIQWCQLLKHKDVLALGAVRGSFVYLIFCCDAC